MAERTVPSRCRSNPAKERGTEEGWMKESKSLRRKCSFKNILEIRWGVLKPKLPIRGSLHFLAAYLA